jgi:hypothetical protein
MNAFFDSLKSDLLDRRLRPIAALFAVALLGALVYAVLAGGSSAPASSVSASAPAVKASGIAVSEVKTDNATPVSETTSGTSQQSGGANRNPFAPVAGLKAASSKSAAASAAAAGSETSSGSGAAASSGAASGSETSSSGSSGTEGSSSGVGSSTEGGGTSTAPSKKSTETAKPQTVYHVSAVFGVAAPGTPPLSASLTPYEKLTRQQPLPSAKQPLIVFRGVIAGGKSATFTLVGEAILRGSAKCLPSASQCQAIDLKAGQSEELEYVPLGGTAVTYLLEVVKITSSKASAAAASRAFGGESKSGLELLRSHGLASLPGLRYSGDKGVLVFAAKHAFAARAHAAVWGAAFKG